ncbi:MAG: transposase, partial [Pseudomonadota bacterium]
MARRIRLEYPGATYHVMSRGNNKQRVFFDREDYELFLSILKEVTVRFNWLCHVYCLMLTHYHLLIETMEANLSRGMHYLNTIFAQSFNKKHIRVGHVFQGRYKAIFIQKERYLVALSKYIAANPVKEGLVEKPDDWPWSSYRATIGLEKTPGFLYTDWLLGQFREHRREAIEA